MKNTTEATESKPNSKENSNGDSSMTDINSNHTAKDQKSKTQSSDISGNFFKLVLY